MIRIFRHYVRIPFIFLGVAESAVFILSVFSSSMLLIYVTNVYTEVAYISAIGPLISSSIVFSVTMVISLLSMGLYNTSYLSMSMISLLVRIGVSFLAGLLAIILCFALIPELRLGYDELLLSLLLSLAMIVALRSLFMNVIDRNRLKRRVMVYGSGMQASQIARLVGKPSKKNDVRILGYIHAEGEQDTVDPSMVRHPKRSLVAFVKERRVSEIVVAVDDRRKSLPVYQLLECRLRGIEVIDISSFFERETKKVRLDLVTPSWLTFSDGFKRGVFTDYLKRSFDILASLSLLLATWPIMFSTAIAILWESGWGSTILYRQTRVGQAQKTFEVLKFRSMIENAEQKGQVRWASKGDDRITRVGSFTRKYRIDELPQILNVLRGEMSFVGPRPERPEFASELARKIPYYLKRHYVKPGITGWAQLKYPYGDSDTDALEKLQYDLYYAKNYSLLFDFVILLQTVEVVLFGKGAR